MIGSAFVQTFKRSRVFAVVSVVVVAVCIFGLVDVATSFGKVHQGVHVGTIDLSGKTLSEAESAIRATYEDRVDTHQVFIFANEETADSLGTVDGVVEGEELSEQLSYEEAQQSKRLWVVDGTSLKAEVPYQDLARQAMAVGRDDGGIIKRIGLLFGGDTIEISARYGDDELENLAHDIDTAIGEPRVDYGIAIEDGTAGVTEGHSGAMIDRAELKRQIDDVLLHSSEQTGSFVARVEYAPLRIDAEQAQKVADAVNSLLESEVSFSHNAGVSSVDRERLGSWIAADVVEMDGGYALRPFIDEENALPELISLLNQNEATGAKTAEESDVAVKFEKVQDSVQVVTQGEIMLPLLDEALTRLDDQMFSTYRSSGDASPVNLQPIDIETYRYTGMLSFDEACDYGVIGRISSYTTNYTSTSATRNRNHNIHLAADLLNDSICFANGGTWSFNETTGDCNEEAGFLDAGAIREGEYVDEVGGGICQVATTVFNAVYEAGYPVVKRAAHSLYMASYEEGRDAAVNFPDLDLIWSNDTTSDVLVRTSYTDTTITVALYGVNPGYTVKTKTGDWEEGKPYRIVVKVDEERSPGSMKVETVGTNGKSISVVRSVYDRDGNFLRDATFNSYYNPIDKVVITGPDTEVEPEEGHEMVTKKYVKESADG